MAIIAETPAVKLTSSLDSVPLSSLINGGNMGNLFGSDGADGSGLIGGLVLGSLLGVGRGSNLFGGATDVATKGLTASDVQTIVATNGIQGNVGELKGQIWQAEGQVQLAIAQDTISNLQGNTAITKAITDGNAAASLQRTASELALLQGQSNIMNGVNLAAKDAAAAISQAKFELAQTVVEDGTRTRDLINATNLAVLNRELAVAQNALSDSTSSRRHAETEVHVTQNVNQAQAQAQQQAQIGVLANGLSVLLAEVQRNTQSVVNLGTMVASPQTATNVRA